MNNAVWLFFFIGGSDAEESGRAALYFSEAKARIQVANNFIFQVMLKGVGQLIQGKCIQLNAAVMPPASSSSSPQFVEFQFVELQPQSAPTFAGFVRPAIQTRRLKSGLLSRMTWF